MCGTRRQRGRQTRLWFLASLILAAGAALFPLAPQARDATVQPAAGVFLVAKRQVTGPLFTQSIVLLFQAGPGGAAGLIVNRPTDLLLREAFDEFPSEREDRVFLGGPLEPRGMLLLFEAKDPPRDSRPLRDQLHLGQSADSLRELIDQGLSSSQMRSFLGYAGWAPGQLEAEIARGDWYVIERDPSLALRARGAKSWEAEMESLEAIRVEAPSPFPRETPPAELAHSKALTP